MHENPRLKASGSSISFIWDFIKIILVALLIILPIRYFIFQPFIVSGASMEPNFQNNEYLVIDELSYRFRRPERGDVLVLRYPKDPKQYFIKRIVGLPGEKIQIDNGRVTIYNYEHPKGFVLDEPYLSNQNLTYPHMQMIGNKNTVTLGEDEYFMMGDNRLASSDSRDWGPLGSEQIIGRVFMRVLPLSEFKFF